MEVALRRFVRERARSICEYCRMPQAFDRVQFEVEHVIPEKHLGPTVADNLALACFFCNRYKGPNLSGIDPQSGAIVPLFNPRRASWGDHFHWNGPILLGLTECGRATIAVLRINDPPRVSLRTLLIEGGDFPESANSEPQ
jgi:hypothetical protein